MPEAPSHILELSVGLVPIEPMPRARGNSGLADRTAVDQEQIQPAIVIEVEEQRAGSHRLDDVLLRAGAIDMLKLDTGLRA